MIRPLLLDARPMTQHDRPCGWAIVLRQRWRCRESGVDAPDSRFSFPAVNRNRWLEKSLSTSERVFDAQMHHTQRMRDHVLTAAFFEMQSQQLTNL
jgi:hypothetical protein